jgi:hypothetical protein
MLRLASVLLGSPIVARCALDFLFERAVAGSLASPSWSTGRRKSSVPQAAKSVLQALIPDIAGKWQELESARCLMAQIFGTV